MIYTFYSYKGGVGRTMALANIAELFYQAGLRVLMVDWDLEAPGLERFFPSISLEKTLNKPGLIDMLLRYKEQVAQDVGENIPVNFESPKRYMINVYPDQSGPGELSLLTAGRRSKPHFAEYARAVLTFDWQDFYERWGGELYFNWLREEFESLANVTLIDSRTGVTEMGGVCTHQLADTVVMLSTTNKQCIDGTYEMAKTFKMVDSQSLRQGRPLNILVVPARIERAESALLDEFQEQFFQMFRDLVPQAEGFDVRYLWQLGIPYVPKYAFAETVAVRESNRASAEDMAVAFRRIHHAMWHLMLSQLAYEHTNEAARRLALAFSNADQEDRSELSQIASLTEIFADPLNEFEQLLIYAYGILDFARGDQESARVQLRRIAKLGHPPTVVGVTLPIPRWTLGEASRHESTGPAVGGSGLIAETTLEQYIFYLRRVEGDDARAAQERRATFEEELRGLLAHLEHLSGQSIPPWEWPQESEDRHVSQRIVTTGWLDNPENGRSCFVEARTYEDVYWLQVGYSKKGQVESRIFACLRDVAWQPAATEHLLGSSAYLCGVATDGMDALAAKVRETFTDSPSGRMVSTHLPCCRQSGHARLYGSVEDPYVTVLLYPRGCEAEIGQRVLNDAAIRLELYNHKAYRQLAWCEDNIPLLSAQEQRLRDLLQEVDQAPLTDMEFLRRLIQLYRIFNSNVGMLVDRQARIEFNLDNLDSVLQELEMQGQDDLLAGRRDRLRRRERQLKVDLTYADRLRQRTDMAVNSIRTQLGLDRLANLQVDLQAEPNGVAHIKQAGWPGTPLAIESEIATITPHQEPPRFISLPQVIAPPHIPLETGDRDLLQHVYRGFGLVLVEKEFGRSYSGARVFLTRPITKSDLPAARRVTKLGPAAELRRERDRYAQYVEDYLPFSAARVERDRYYEQDGRAGLNYIFVGDGALSHAVDLEEYYRQTATGGDAGPIVQTLGGLLDRALGDRWYGYTTPLNCSFAAEYGRHLVEHLRLRLRPASSDGLWTEDRAPAPVSGYRRIEVERIPAECDATRSGTLVTIHGLVVRRIKRRAVKLEDPGGLGIVVRVASEPESDAAQRLKLGDRVAVRGEVVYNRHKRMQQIVGSALPNLLPGIDSEFVKLPCEVKAHPNWTYPNPLAVYPKVLSKSLAARRSYVHGDLHLRNVLVDEWGKGWLIDFARVEKRHNIFDFIKLETYVRLMGLSRQALDFSLCDYARFEEALNDTVLSRNTTPPDDPHLMFAYQVIRAIRDIARKYMVPEHDFQKEYFPALFLYSLAVMKYHQETAPQPTRLLFVTACVQARYILRTRNHASLGQSVNCRAHTQPNQDP